MRKPLHSLLLVYVLICLSSITKAQPVCGFDKVHRQLELQHPAYKNRVEQNEVKLRNWLDEHKPSGNLQVDGRVPNGPETIYEIPVVIHVIHTGGAVGTNYNPADAQLTGMIDYLNQSFQATWASYPLAGAGGTRVPFRFILAQRAPDCTPTTGIVRVDGSSIPGYVANGVFSQSAGADDSLVKAITLWPANQYYNVYVVNKIDGKDGYPGTVGPFVAGFAYFPGAPMYIDGTIMLASQAKSGQSTLPHEMGHAFNLFHTFQGATGATCPPNANCNTQGDRVCDTDPTNEQAFFTCPLSTDNNPCTGTPWSDQRLNFMHYTSCAQKKFTPGQRDRMIASVNALRNGLMTSAALTPPPATTVTAALCQPLSIVHLNNNNDMGATRLQLNTLDDSTNSYTPDWVFYVDNTCNMGTNMIMTQNYTISVSTNTNRQIVKVYIDYNDNGSFEAGELVMNSTTPASPVDYTHTTSITPPVGAVLNKPLRMRVVADFFTNSSIGPCSNLQYGQTKDYAVTILPASALPVKIYDESIKVRNNKLQFSFKVGEQQMVKTYALQRANKKGNDFITVKEFAPSSGINGNAAYAVEDDQYNNSSSWYRILATELDGAKFYSRILGTGNSEDDAAGYIKVSPNPSRGSFTVAVPVPPGTNVQLVLTDAFGKTVWNGSRISDRPITISGSFPAGLYFLRATAGQLKWSSKVVITGN
ncbi:T9SS type A sorting domain-containing protein [Pseudoflavitalea sp. G-6-1-2]|uniref:M43 family zinc metalloprotease n=1 Tax=Pseudoflavitalea sp. G-6-1-2 TaxID=2728841 RepID=UPI00146D0AEB|nr:M43 family zinc metalloprotease [Pseudoflavitalea sp. G-6-1-2]NML21435.1 T9SS type A sorting domain-containing protein [Pseudoflavitalea sp. G-6-1-2]